MHEPKTVLEISKKFTNSLIYLPSPTWFNENVQHLHVKNALAFFLK